MSDPWAQAAGEAPPGESGVDGRKPQDSEISSIPYINLDVTDTREDTGGNDDGWQVVGAKWNNDINCDNCGSTAHFTRNCDGSGPPEKVDTSCYICGVEGHSKADCPERHQRSSGGCFNCGEEGHNKADCPMPRQKTGECYNCGEHGHNKADCPKPRQSYGACFNCGEEGHAKADCPKPRQSFGACFNCGEDGHAKADCPNPRPSFGACFNCGEEGHSKADCPKPRQFSGECFNCGEEGHSKADCPKPRVFKGACRLCGQEGHPKALCPEKPVDICHNCKGMGHISRDCTAPRKFDLNHIADKLPEEAWAQMKAASDNKDIDEFREAIQVYTKARPLETYADIEKKMREENFNIHMIALEKDPVDVISLIDLQGQLNRTYVVGFFFSNRANRLNLRQRWPADDENNLERLADAGLPYDRLVMKCRNCGELGHGSRGCKQERVEHERVEIKCRNCDAVGHRVRDCKEPRKNLFACRNCGSEEHLSRECPEPRSADNVECRKCNEMGHYAKDCPKAGDRPPRTCRNCGSEDHIARDCDQPRNQSTMICHNCDEAGHSFRDCPHPKDWSRVKCNRCGEMGHTVRRCPQPEDPEPAETGAFEMNWGAAGGETAQDDAADEAGQENETFEDARDNLGDQMW